MPIRLPAPHAIGVVTCALLWALAIVAVFPRSPSPNTAAARGCYACCRRGGVSPSARSRHPFGATAPFATGAAKSPSADEAWVTAAVSIAIGADNGAAAAAGADRMPDVAVEAAVAAVEW